MIESINKYWDGDDLILETIRDDISSKLIFKSAKELKEYCEKHGLGDF